VKPWRKLPMLLNNGLNKEIIMSDQEYVKWIVMDTVKEMGQAVGIYAVALLAYWALVA
jgi:hypothetical protein